MSFIVLEHTALISLTAAIFGAILITIILYGHKHVSARYLALFFCTLCSSNYLVFLFESRYLLQMPFFFRVGPLISYLLAPSMFFYMLFVLNIKRRLCWWDALHLLPALLFLVDYFPLFVSSNSYKRQLIEALYHHPQQVVLFQEGWLVPPGIHQPLRYLIIILYVLYLARILGRIDQKVDKESRIPGTLLNWLKTILTLVLLMSLTGLSTSFFSYSGYSWTVTVWAPLIVSTVLGVVLLSKPSLLYGANRHLNTKPAGEKPKQLILPEEIFLQIKVKLDDFIEKKHFLRKNIKLKEVADELQIQPHILSAYINQVHQFRFNDLINCCRIEYILNDGFLDKQKSMLTLEGIAEAAGFTNRTTFLNSFKKVTGMTPTAYLHQQRNKDLPQAGVKDSEQAN